MSDYDKEKVAEELGAMKKLVEDKKKSDAEFFAEIETAIVEIEKKLKIDGTVKNTSKKIEKVISIEDLDLSNRTFNALKGDDKTDTTKISRAGGNELLKIRYFGKKSLTELENVMKYHELPFSDEPLEIEEETTEKVVLEKITNPKEIRIEDAGFGRSILNACEKNGLQTLGDIIKFGANFLLKVRNTSAREFRDMKEILKNHGLLEKHEKEAILDRALLDISGQLFDSSHEEDGTTKNQIARVKSLFTDHCRGKEKTYTLRDFLKEVSPDRIRRFGKKSKPFLFKIISSFGITKEDWRNVYYGKEEGLE
jgi:DNA-directed RNA polymerase alpha subunit